MRLGTLFQSVVYKGLNLLCFSCGHLGHRKSNSPYTIQNPIPAPANHLAEDATSTTGILVRKDHDDYGPWTIVQRRKPGRQPNNRKVTSSSKPSTIFLSFGQKDKAPTNSSPIDNTSSGIQSNRSVEGKRKLARQSFTSDGSTNPLPKTPIFSFNCPDLSTCSESQPLLEPLTSPRVVTPDLSKHATSSKGKGKSPRHVNTKPSSMGHSTQRANLGSPTDNARTHQSYPNNNSRVVQPGVANSLEKHFSTNKREPEARDSAILRSSMATLVKPLVEVPDGPPDTSTGEDLIMEDASLNISRANLMRIQPIRRADRTENASGSANCSSVPGEQIDQETDPGTSSEVFVQSPSLPTRVEYGHYGTHSDSDARKRPTKRVLKEMGWSLLEQMRTLPQIDECPTPDLSLLMNIIMWNCRGALNPNFRRSITELVNYHSPSLLIVTETRVGGD